MPTSQFCSLQEIICPFASGPLPLTPSLLQEMIATTIFSRPGRIAAPAAVSLFFVTHARVTEFLFFSKRPKLANPEPAMGERPRPSSKEHARTSGEAVSAFRIIRSCRVDRLKV